MLDGLVVSSGKYLIGCHDRLGETFVRITKYESVSAAGEKEEGKSGKFVIMNGRR